MNSPRPAEVDGAPADLSLDDLDRDTLFRLVEASANGIVFVDTAWAVVHANGAALRTFGVDEGAVVGADLRSHLDEAGDATLQRAADRESYRARVVRADGDHREIAFWTIPVDADGETLRAVLFDDATASARLERVAGALAHIAGALAFDQPIDATLDDIARRVMESTRAIACAVVLIDESPLRIRSAGSAGLITTDWKASATSWLEGAYSPTPEAYREGRPVVESFAKQRMLADPTFHAMHDEFRASVWDSVAAHPLMDDGEAIGVMTAYYAGAAPGPDEVGLLAAIARHAAMASRSAKLFEERRSAAALEERQQLAHELHDSVSQVLYGIALGSRTAQARIPGQPRAAAEAIDYVLGLADAGLAEMRALLFELRPDSLEEEGLRSALAKQAAALRARYGIRIDERLEVEPDLPFEAKESLYRIAQEALRETIRARTATQIEVALTEAPGVVALSYLTMGAAATRWDRRPAGGSSRTARPGSAERSWSLRVVLRSGSSCRRASGSRSGDCAREGRRAGTPMTSPGFAEVTAPLPDVSVDDLDRDTLFPLLSRELGLIVLEVTVEGSPGGGGSVTSRRIADGTARPGGSVALRRDDHGTALSLQVSGERVEARP